jgi:hypothetical protein
MTTKFKSVQHKARMAMLVSLSVLLAVSGCQTRPAEWTKPGAVSADLRRDLADCEREGTGQPPFHFWALNEDYESARDRVSRVKHECMAARGWRPVAETEAR